ncbi:hypothetical protein GCK72_000732 [Caenorhabditis remanei]|uniref:Uncharacterized protein n=1 Tax=Caenorhabditis remanei TaxID=31234 RepID=A0A6A5HMQ9_CAERE|nr:hypothetical protein GCK72_000732 [Caenorhabditis remanei]KAF1768919.1 hypothetical protein GCK72_000732 [Caenorhabditis remanei]
MSDIPMEYNLDDSGLEESQTGTYLNPPSKAEAELHKEEILEKIKSLEDRIVANNLNTTNLLEVQEVGMRKIVLQLETIKSTIAETRKATKRPGQEQQVEKKKSLLQCQICQQPHSDVECPQLSPSQRMERAVKAQKCLNCLKKHKGNCRNAPSCKFCEGAHNSVFHVE